MELSRKFYRKLLSTTGKACVAEPRQGKTFPTIAHPAKPWIKFGGRHLRQINRRSHLPDWEQRSRAKPPDPTPQMNHKLAGVLRKSVLQSHWNNLWFPLPARE